VAACALASEVRALWVKDYTQLVVLAVAVAVAGGFLALVRARAGGAKRLASFNLWT